MASSGCPQLGYVVVVVLSVVCGPINFLDRAINMFLFRRFNWFFLAFIAVVAVCVQHVVAAQFVVVVLYSSDVSEVCVVCFGYAISCIIIAN